MKALDILGKYLSNLVVWSFRSVFVFVLRAYQIFLSPLKRPSCRYYPTCSTYSLTLFRLSHPLEALFFSIIRVFRCNPWAKGGFDYPMIRVTLDVVEHQPIRVVYWIVPLKPLMLHFCIARPLKFKGYILLKD